MCKRYKLWLCSVGLICWGLMAAMPSRAADLPVPTEGEAEPSTPAVEAQKFAGTWKLVSLERDGFKFDSQSISDVRLVFDSNQYTYKGQDGKRDQGTFELDKDTLKFCAPGPDEKMPDGFTAPHGSGRELAVWKRAKS